MKVFFFAIFFLQSAYYAFSQSQPSEFFKSADANYHIYIPKDWIKETPKQNSIVFSLRPADGKQDEVPTAMFLEILPVSLGYETANMREITDKELEITKNQYGNSFTILSQQYRNINNKEWSQMIAEVRVSKKKAFKFFILKAVHNAKTYALSFAAESEDYEKYINRAFAAMQTFMFYTTDRTLYKNDNTYLSPITIEKQMAKYNGTYTHQPHPTYFNSIVLGNATDGPYKAKEIRRLTKDGKTYIFEAELKVEEITESKIVLTTDAVLKFDPDMQFRKAVYELNRTDKGFSGQFVAKDSTFEKDIVSFVNQNLSTTKSQPKTKIDNVVQTPEPKKNLDLENDADEDNDLANRTYDYANWEGDANNIKRFGQGKVRRVSEHALSFTLTTGKTVLVKDKFVKATKDMSAYYETGYSFGGYSDSLNSFILFQEDGLGNLVNRTTGVLSDDLPQIDDILRNSKERISPDKKWVCTYENYSEVSDDAGGMFKIFSAAAGFKKIYEKEEGHNGKEWYPGNIIWTGNTTLEIEKLNTDSKKIGTCWLQLQNGKWTLLNSKPSYNSHVSTTAINKTLPISTAKGDETFKLKRIALPIIPVFSGSITKRWQVAGLKEGPYIEHKRRVVEFEFLPGSKFNAYEDGNIQGSGTYVLATDKKSVLLKDGNQSASMKILQLTADQCIFLAARDTMICYPANSAPAKAALAKQALIKKSVRDWYGYYNAVSSLFSQQRNLIRDLPLSQRNNLKEIEEDGEKLNVREEAYYNVAFINSLFSAMNKIRSNTPLIITRIENDAELMKNESIITGLNYLKKLQLECEQKEGAAIQFLNKYYDK